MTTPLQFKKNMNENYGPGEDDYGRNPSIIDILIAKKNYVQAVRESIRTFHENTINYNYSFEMVIEAQKALQRLGIEPNYSLIVKEMKGL